MGNRFFHVFCDHGTSGNGCCCRQWNSEYFQKSCCMLLPRTWKCRQYHSGKPSWCRPPAGSKGGRRNTYQNCDYCRNCIRPCPDRLVPIYHKNGRSHPDSPRISAKNAADLFLLHRRKISKLYDNRRNLRSRRRLQIWNAVWFCNSVVYHCSSGMHLRIYPETAGYGCLLCTQSGRDH